MILLHRTLVIVIYRWEARNICHYRRFLVQFLVSCDFHALLSFRFQCLTTSIGFLVFFSSLWNKRSFIFLLSLLPCYETCVFYARFIQARFKKRRIFKKFTLIKALSWLFCFGLLSFSFNFGHFEFCFLLCVFLLSTLEVSVLELLNKVGFMRVRSTNSCCL